MPSRRITFTPQSLRTDLGRGGEGSCARPRREPQRPPSSQRRRRPRRLSRKARPTGATAAVATPTSQHRKHEAGGNWFAPARLRCRPPSASRDRSSASSSNGWRRRKEPALQVASRVAQTLGRLPMRMLCRRSTPRPIRRLRRYRTPRTSGRTSHLRVAGRGQLSARPAARLPDEHHGVRQRGCLDIGIAIDPSAFTEPDPRELPDGPFDTYRRAPASAKPG